MKTLLIYPMAILFSLQVFAADSYGHGNEFITFQEKNVQFYLYPDGSFDFKVHHYDNPRESRVFASISTPYLQINYRGGGRDYYNRAYLRYDRYGKITQIDDVYIDYDAYGQLRYIGSVNIYYHNGYVSRISHPYANYGSYQRYYRPQHAVYAQHRPYAHYKKPYHPRAKKGYAYGRYKRHH
ncbi:MAG: hypothetical protein RQ735_03900 [Flavobacteriaceae bacterium]|nr:hypothetical protein [Flavobacteriaceae bacterium]